MFNPILRDQIAREQHKDLIREAEQVRLVKAAIEAPPAQRFKLRASLGSLLSAVGRLFKAPEHANHHHTMRR